MSIQSYKNTGRITAFLLTTSLLLLAFLLPSPAESKAFVHPSILTSNEQLDALSSIDIKSDTLKSALAQLTNSEFASLERTFSPYKTVYVEAYTGNKYEEAFTGDAHAARALALMWVVTSDQKYAIKAISILNSWAKTFEKIEVTKGGKDQAYLEASWVLPIWTGAADIIRYYRGGKSGWKKEHITQFDKFLKKLLHYSQKAYRENNWGASSVLSQIALGAYWANTNLYENGLTLYKKNLEKVSTSQGILTADYLRDTWHPQYVLIAWMQSSEIAWHNGDDLYGITFRDSCPRLLTVLEHFSELFSGKIPSPENLKKSNYKNSHLKTAGYQLAFNHYFQRTSHKSCGSTFKEIIPDWYPGGTNKHFMSWDSLTHSFIKKSGK